MHLGDWEKNLAWYQEFSFISESTVLGVPSFSLSLSLGGGGINRHWKYSFIGILEIKTMNTE